MWTLRASALFVAAVLLCALAAQAGAVERIQFRPGGEILATGVMGWESEGLSITCNVTLAGTLTRSLFNAVAGTQFGSLTRTVGRSGCSGGEYQLLYPIPLTLERLLPQAGRIIGVLARLNGGGVLIEDGIFARCLYGLASGILISIQAERTTLRFLGEALRLVTRLPGSITCPATIRPTGALTITPTQEVAYLP